LVTGMKTEPITVKSMSEMCVVNLRLWCLDERAMLWAHWLVLVTGFYGARYVVGMFVMGVPIEARYLVISVCNEI
jgi:hypothetical protein